MTRVYSALVLAAVLTVSGTAQATLINGSFEDPALSGPGNGGGSVGNFTRFSASNFMPGWTLVSGNVEVFHTFGSDGDQSVDLTGFPASAAATLEQTFASVVGTTYDVSFDLIAAGDGPRDVRVNILRADDSVLSTQVFSFDAQGVPLAQLSFESNGFSFVADEAFSTLEFASLHTSDFNGPMIDNVVVVPEPSTGLLIGLGLCAISRRSREFLDS